MKRAINRIAHILCFFTVVIVLFPSCEYQEYADADYPDQLIYMPAAYYNPFLINVVPEERGSTPTPGYPVRFQVDPGKAKFNVLLGVYRSGIDNTGSFMVDVAVNTDTITKLLAGTNPFPEGTVLLPAGKYSIVNSVELKEGEDIAKFDLVVDLNFLVSNSPDAKYALGVQVSSNSRETNPGFATTLVVIDTKIMFPTANFTSAADGGNAKLIKFTNTSTNGVDYLWDFGDGGTSEMKAPSHTYANAGTYNVKLTTIGITGEQHKVTYSSQVTIP